MERGELQGYFVLNALEKRIAVEALRAAGYEESPAELEKFNGKKEIPPFVMSEIVKAVRELINRGAQPYAQMFLDSYEQLSLKANSSSGN